MAETVSDSVDVPHTSKAFVPIENNPEVMTAMVHSLGLSRTLSFHDVFSIDDASLLAFVPRPALALLLVFPVSKTYESYRVSEDQDRPPYEGKGADEPVVWYRQTIRNACGLMALLHAVSNGAAREMINSNSALDKLVKEAIPLAPTARSDLLYHSHALESAHASAAQEGQSVAPAATDDVDLHYVCFVKDVKMGHLWELDGRRTGPLDRGALDADEDVLSARALEWGPRRFMSLEEEKGSGEMRFSLVTLAPSLD